MISFFWGDTQPTCVIAELPIPTVVRGELFLRQTQCQDLSHMPQQQLLLEVLSRNYRRTLIKSRPCASLVQLAWNPDTCSFARCRCPLDHPIWTHLRSGQRSTSVKRFFTLFTSCPKEAPCCAVKESTQEVLPARKTPPSSRCRG